jgi:outer membrane immunogenic protein
VRTKLGNVACGLTAALLATTGAIAQEKTDWSGFYAGVYAGYALDTAEASSSSISIPNFDVDENSITSYDQTSDNGRIDGAIAGIGAGYNLQFDQIVLGVEAAIHSGALGKKYEGRLVSQEIEDGETATFDSSSEAESKVDWYTSLTGTFGIAFEQDWMVYAKGGVAFGNVSTSSEVKLAIDATDPEMLPEEYPPGVSSGTTSGSMLVAGPTVGFGVERKLADNLSVGAEYAYVGLGEVTFQGAIAGPTVGGEMMTFPLNFHTVKAALKYHF